MSEQRGNLLGVPYLERDQCIFCRPRQHEILDQNEWAITLHDNYPVAEGHCLIVPRRHAATFFDLDSDEWVAVQQLAERARQRLMAGDSRISGFNLGVNAGASAGQSVFHCHFHLFPRRDGDQQNPRGGVRRIFPDKALYVRKSRPPRD